MNEKIGRSTKDIRNRLLARTGKFYPILVMAVLQLVSNLGAVPAAYFIQINAEMTTEQFSISAILTLALMLISNTILLALFYIFNRKTFARLHHVVRETPLSSDTTDELTAWKQISSLAWRYGIISTISALIIVVTPLSLFQYFVLGIPLDKLNFVVIGGLISTIAIVLLGVIGIEYYLEPARELLLPMSFDKQLSGVSGARLLVKLLIPTVGLILFSILLVAPIGYHQMLTVLFGDVAPGNIVRIYQIQSAVVSFMALALGFILSFLLFGLISTPVRSMIDTLKKVESGDLKQRAKVLATDEVGELAIHFNRMIARLDEMHEGLEQQVVERTFEAEQRSRFLEAAAEVGRVATSILNEDELIQQVVGLINEHFDLYYTGLFLLDENQDWAILKAGTGEAGKALLQRGHRIKVGSGMVGWCIANAQPRIAQQTEKDTVRLVTSELSLTKSEAAIPLRSRGRVLGALTVQSEQPNAFSITTITTLQTMADNVATAIDNAHLFSETQDALDFTRRAYSETSQIGWQKFLKDTKVNYARHSKEKVSKQGTDKSDPALERAIRTGRPVLADEETTLMLPIKVRDFPIGAIRLRKPEGADKWSEDEIHMAETLSDHIGVALESARLYAETRQRAERERAVSEIVSKIGASLRLETILRTVVEELGQTLGGTEVVFQLAEPLAKEVGENEPRES